MKIKGSFEISDDHIDERSELESGSVDATKLVPGQHHSLIGVQPSDQALKVEDITDIRQLETLMRVHVMLAHVEGHCSPRFVDYALMAYAFLYRIWQVTHVVTFPILVELIHAAMSMENIKSPSSKNATQFRSLCEHKHKHVSLLFILFGRENDLFKSKFFFSNM